MLLLEINEFNPELMQKAADELQLSNLQKLLSLNLTLTTTDDKEERFGLDPWVQWVSIHTGKPSSEHGVGHLGDVPQLDDPQIWEKLSQRGITCGVWGAMNASRGNTEHCDFFFPDPWTFSEEAHPPELNDLLMFPRYYSKNYGDLDKGRMLKEALKLLRFCLRPGVFFTLLPLLPVLMINVLRRGVPAYLLFVLFDLVNAALFAHYYRKSKPRFNILFMNSLAHLQHHKWTNKDGLSDEMRVAFALFDKAIGVLWSGLDPDESIVITNAFTQYCTYDRNEILYRQINPEGFLRAAGIAFVKVEQLMTNDAHVFFASTDEAMHYRDVLESATVDGQKIFHVEYDERVPEKVFYQMAYWADIPAEAELTINNKTLDFYNQFEKITQRSGSHTSRGHIYSSSMTFPKEIYNHELHNHILKFFAAN